MEAYKNFERKITPYLDGSLSKDEHAEFEAFVLTHPEFEEKIRSRQEEIRRLHALIPVPVITKESLESLETELRSSVFNLLKEEPQSLWGLVKCKWEDFINR